VKSQEKSSPDKPIGSTTTVESGRPHLPGVAQAPTRLSAAAAAAGMARGRVRNGKASIAETRNMMLPWVKIADDSDRYYISLAVGRCRYAPPPVYLRRQLRACQQF